MSFSFIKNQVGACVVLCLLWMSVSARAEHRDPKRELVQGASDKCRVSLTLPQSTVSATIQAGRPLPNEMAVELFLQWKNSTSTLEKNQFRNRLFNGYVRLLAKMTRKWWKRNRHLEFDDLFQEGASYFTRALEKFDPDKGTLASHLENWFLAGITSFIRSDFSEFASGVRQSLATNYFMNRSKVHSAVVVKGEESTSEHLAQAFNLLSGELQNLSAAEYKKLVQKGWVATPQEVELIETAITNFRDGGLRLQRPDGSTIELASPSADAIDVISQNERAALAHKEFSRFRNTLKTDRERATFDFRMMAEPEQELTLLELNSRYAPGQSRQAADQLQKKLFKRLGQFLRERGTDELR